MQSCIRDYYLLLLQYISSHTDVGTGGGGGGRLEFKGGPGGFLGKNFWKIDIILSLKEWATTFF